MKIIVKIESQKSVAYYSPLILVSAITVCRITSLAKGYRLPIHSISFRSGFSLVSPVQWPRNIWSFSVEASILMIRCELNLYGIQTGVVITQCCPCVCFSSFLSLLLWVGYTTKIFQHRNYVTWDDMVIDDWWVGCNFGWNGRSVQDFILALETHYRDWGTSWFSWVKAMWWEEIALRTPRQLSFTRFLLRRHTVWRIKQLKMHRFH